MPGPTPPPLAGGQQPIRTSLRKGDQVIVLAGRDKGKRGTVSLRKDDSFVIVDGINLVKKHTKPNPLKGTTGGIVEKAMPIHQSNVAIFNAATGKADRVGIKVTDGKRVRVFKSSGEEIKAPKGVLTWLVSNNTIAKRSRKI
jgi:large subunit ribosomal protein L24